MNRAMLTTCTALVLGLLAGVTGVGCKDDEQCDFYFPATGGDYQKTKCDLADVAAECVGDRDFDALTDDEVESLVQACIDLEDVCADDPSVMNGIAGTIAWELQGKTNDCVG